MTDNDDICGSTDTYHGEPCGNPAGHGTDSDIGPCYQHTTNRGRNSKRTEERVEEILEAAREGTTVEGCCRAAGIGVSTLYDWFDRDPELSERFNRARHQGERRLVEEVAEEDPKFLLERSYEYSKTERKEHLVDSDADLDEDSEFDVRLIEE